MEIPANLKPLYEFLLQALVTVGSKNPERDAVKHLIKTKGNWTLVEDLALFGKTDVRAIRLGDSEEKSNVITYYGVVRDKPVSLTLWDDRIYELDLPPLKKYKALIRFTEKMEGDIERIALYPLLIDHSDVTVEDIEKSPYFIKLKNIKTGGVSNGFSRLVAFEANALYSPRETQRASKVVTVNDYDDPLLDANVTVFYRPNHVVNNIPIDEDMRVLIFGSVRERDSSELEYVVSAYSILPVGD